MVNTSLCKLGKFDVWSIYLEKVLTFTENEQYFYTHVLSQEFVRTSHGTILSVILSKNDRPETGN